MDDDVAVTFPEKAGGLHASHVIVCIHAGDVLILALNPHNRDLAGGLPDVLTVDGPNVAAYASNGIIQPLAELKPIMEGMAIHWI